MASEYTIPARAHIGHVHLKVSDIKRSLEFYCGLLGFELITTYGADAAFISAGGYHHHIGLNTWQSKGRGPGSAEHTGLYHVAIVYPTRKDLAVIYQRLVNEKVRLAGTADHGVSEALYLNDPDRNGMELYWDRPREEWPMNPDGSLIMYTLPLDLDGLLKEIE